MTQTYDVLINGGGPVGMGLAIELGQRGVKTCVIERHFEPQPIPKGQNLTQRTCEHFRAWGCEEEIRTAHPIPEGGGIGGMTAYGTLISDYHYDWLNRAHVKDYYFAAHARLPQYATERVLRARAAQIPEVTIRYGWSGTKLVQDNDGIRLTANNGETGETEQFEATYIVGCDGSRSFVRRAAGIGETLSDHDRRMALLVFRSVELHELLKCYPGKAFYCVLHPRYEGYWQFFGRVDHGLSWFFHAPVPMDTSESNFDFEALLHRAVGREFELEFERIGFWDLRVSLADSYRRGRAFIAGDAAHSHPPYGGYGVNTGFEDARNLGWKLAAVLKGYGDPSLLDSYEAERRPVFASTARDFIERFIEDDREFLRSYSPDRDEAAFRRAWNSRNDDADEVNSFEPNYDGSPIVFGNEDATPSARGAHSFKAQAGHHLSPPGAKPFPELGPDFTLLAADACACQVEQFARAANGLKVPVKIEKMQETWHDAYEASLVLVRPDGFVAWTGDRSDDPRSVLNRALGGST